MTATQAEYEFDISAILTGHHEGAMAGLSWNSMLAAAADAEAHGLSVEFLVMLDNPNAATTDMFVELDGRARVEVVSYADQGLVRNHAVGSSRGRYVAFLDGDDLWSENWLVEAHAMCSSDPGRIIAHPQADWFFDGDNSLFFHVDQTDPGFDPAFLRIANYWDALCLAPREAYLDHPFSKRAISEGYAYEDWQWNIDTMMAGYVHRVAPDTLHFKRRRVGSQTMEASGTKALTRRSVFYDYGWSGWSADAVAE